MKTELVRAQADVEAAMLSLKDEEIAHLVALGGWVRGLEITSGIVIENYSTERARRLVQPELIDYFLDRVDTLNPNIKKTRLGQALDKNLKEVKKIITKPVDTPIEADEVKRIRDLTRELTRMAASADQ